MKKKVLHVINSLNAGGAETLLVNSLAPGGLQEHTDNMVVYFQGTSELEKKIDKRITCHSLNYKGLLSLPATLKKLRRIIKEQQIDIVHSHLNPAGFYTHLVCPVPHVHTLHTIYSKNTETKPIKLFLEKELFFKKKKCNIILLSEFIKEDFLKTVPFRGKTFVLNNFVEDIFFRPTAKTYTAGSGSLKLIAVGRLSEVKNFEYLLEVFSHLKDTGIELDIYGGGNIKKYEQLIKKAGLKINMKGHNNNIGDVIGNYDLFIMPSKFEGFPLSLFEAMASGIPLMLSDIASLNSIVKEHALYFSLHDAAGTARILKGIAAGTININSMAANAQEFARKTAKREMYIKNLLHIYDQL
jgi:glycosyltransferase involved in cell wall biosynthesis